MEFTVRRIQTHDWELAKCVRLASLADAPAAFASTLDEELQLPEASWRARAASNAAGVDTVGFFAVRRDVQDVPCGMVIGVRQPTGDVVLNALWVAANVRRRGIAGDLTQAVLTWARERGARRVELEVTTASHAAIALYRSLGFEGSSEPASTCGTRRAPALRMQRHV